MTGGTPTSNHLVVVGMGVTAPQEHDRLAALAAAYAGSVAFLQQGEPGLTTLLTGLADAGQRRVTLVGVAGAQPCPGGSWLRRVAAHWWRERPDPPEVLVASGLVGTTDEVAAALSGARALTGAEAPLTSPAWEEVPGHRHQVLLCRGPRCTARGAEDTARGLVLELMRLGLGDDDVLVTHTGCQFPCNHAPVVSVQPDDVWYGHVDGEGAGRIARDHLAAGAPVTDLRLARRRHPDPTPDERENP